jgi:hypothetical protein
MQAQASCLYFVLWYFASLLNIASKKVITICTTHTPSHSHCPSLELLEQNQIVCILFSNLNIHLLEKFLSPYEFLEKVVMFLPIYITPTWIWSKAFVKARNREREFGNWGQAGRSFEINLLLLCLSSAAVVFKTGFDPSLSLDPLLNLFKSFYSLSIPCRLLLSLSRYMIYISMNSRLWFPVERALVWSQDLSSESHCILKLSLTTCTNHSTWRRAWSLLPLPMLTSQS